jgi:threonine dehydrogenase-like Zn-dependent dehydrogenase
MKAAVYEGIKKIKVTNIPDPKAESNEVIVRMKYCGICGTDVHIFSGGRKPLEGTVLGHENVGTVAEVGPGVKGWKVGDRVVVGPPGSCGECYYCLHGFPHICVHALKRTTGLSPGVDGGMAEYIRVRYPDNMLHLIPDSVSFEDAVLFDTIGVALRGIRASRFKIGDNVVVAGAGAIGLPAVQLLKIGGASHISVIQRSEKKRKLALELGGDLGFDPALGTDVLKEKMMALYYGVGPDVVYECSGSTTIFEMSAQLVKNGGQVMLIGAGGDTTFSEMDLVRREVEMKGSLAYQGEDVDIILGFLAKGVFKTTGIVSDIVGLDDVVEGGIERLLSDRNLIKVLVEL